VTAWRPWRVARTPAPRLQQSLNPNRPAHNLPASLTSFIGRERELAEVRARLADVRLLTLTGVGGCGKTRLALEVARAVLDLYRDGVWLVEFAPLADPALVPYSVAAVVAARETAGQSANSALAARLCGRRLLLVLDNCEHLLSACACLADALLRACSNLHVLATSREPLGITGEIAWRVPSLSVPDPHHLPPLFDLQLNPAVQLFTERATASRPHFVLTDRNAPAVVQVCQRLDGIPLALELAAARMDALSAEQLAARLDHRFQLLTDGSRAALPRQQTLRATLDWSYELLSERERRLFNRLSVFAGGWTLEAAEAVCAGDGVAREDVLDVLLRLVRKSLVLAELEGAGTERYRLLETLRQYARERLVAAGESDSALRQHAVYFLAFEERLYPTRVRPTKWPHWVETRPWGLDQIACEQDNLRSAIRWLIDSGDAEDGVRLAQAVTLIISIRGSLAEGLAWIRELLAVPAVADTPAVREPILQFVGEIAARHGDYATAHAAFDELLAAYSSKGDLLGVASALSFLAVVYFDLGYYRQARAYLEQSQSVAPDQHDQEETYWWRYRAGSIALHEGRLDDAQVLFNEAMKLKESDGDMVGWCKKDLGWVALEQSAYREARSFLEQALQVGEEFGDRHLVAYSLEGFSSLAAALEQHQRAVCLAGASAALRETRGNPAPPTWQRMYERRLKISRAKLSDATVAAAWTTGRAMPLEEAIRYAQTHVEALRRTGVAPAAAEDRLTRREHEVAALVAQGLTNRKIAEQLVITQRTVAAHVEHILNKLGFVSRHQVATWAAEHKLLN
jgi:predicted ATPase/DNA-binding CsgD family transcriptional regulator